MRGALDDDAAEADEDLEKLLERDYCRYVDTACSVRGVGDWLDASRHEVTAEMTDEALTAWADECERSAASERVRLVGSALDWATEVRADLRTNLESSAIDDA